MLRFLRVLTLFLVSFLSFDVASWATTSSGFYCDASKTYVECDAGYYLSDCGSYRDGRTITRPAAGNSCKACPSATSSAYYECSGGAVCPVNAMSSAEFIVSTTELSAGTKISFSISAAGTYYINWGDGSVIQKIEKTNTTNTVYSHTYAASSSYRIGISGQATRYNTSTSVPAISFKDNRYIESVNGSLGAVFGTLSDGTNPRFYQTFYGVTGLKGIPGDLFSGISGQPVSHMFAGTFQNCSGLTLIPSGLFNGISGAAPNLFQNTFNGCTGIKSIPDGLFANVSGSPLTSLFDHTFYGCTGITSIPENLFGRLSGSLGSDCFKNMFNGCTSLTGRSAKIGGQYIYDIWPSAETTQVGGMYTNATGLVDYPCIPTNYGGAGRGVCVDIVYDANGGTGNPPTSPLVCVYGQPCPAPENTYTYTGKSFTHWKRAIDGSDSNVIYPGPGQDILSGMTSAAVNAADNITLSAQWGNPSMYTVMLNNTDMGGTGGTTEVYTTGGVVFYSDAAGTTAIRGIRVPTKQNATYLGHYTTSDAQCIGQSGEFTFASGCEVTSDTRWYARYQCNTGWTDAGTVINEICAKNITVNLNNLYATKKGTEILYARGGSGQVFVDEDYTDMLRAITIPENVPVFTFDTDGGTVDLSGVTGNPAITNVTDNSITLNPLVFNGYYSAASGGTQYIDATGALTEAGMVAIAKSTENLTWYAQWNTGANIMPMPTPVRAGYNFQMWNVAYDGNGQTQTISVSAGQRLGVPTSAVVTAYWTPRCNEITLNPTSGTAGAVTTLYKLTDSDSWYTDLKCTALVQDLSSVIPSRVGYLFRGFYPQSYDKEYIRDIADDYETLIPAVITPDMIIPGWNTTSASTLYASWVKKCEAPNNGTCSVSIGPGGQMVNYTTTCNTGYAISGNNTATPVCTADSYTCSAGQYLNGATCATCMAGSYCTGGTYTYNGEIQGQSACPSGYGSSDAGSDSESDCYRSCTTSDVVNATAVSGRVYSDGTNACDATGCKNGYSVKSGLDLNSTIGTVWAYDSTDDTSAMTFGVDYGDLGAITGHAQCSTQGGTGIWNGASSADQVTTSDSLPDSRGRYCWCSLDGYTPSGGVTQSLSGPWVVQYDIYDAEDCADACAFYCSNALQDDYPDSLVFRAALFGSLGTDGAQCVPNTYTVSYAANGGTGSAPTSPTSCTYDSDCMAPANTYTKTGYTFAGWTCTGGGESCNGDVISAGGSLKNVSTGTAITLTAKWTANTYTVSYAGNGNTGGSAPTAPKSCTYDGTCTAPANTYTKTGYTFAGWTCTGGGESCNGDVIAAGGSLKNVSTGTAITLTAKWTANVYKVTLDKQGGTGGTAEYYYQYKTKGNCYYYTTSDLTVCTDSSNGGTIAVPTRTGYTFGGYYTGTNGSGTQYVTAAGVTTGSLYSNVAADTTLYAKWTANTYTVSFNANGGTGGQSANVTVTYDAEMPAISTTAPSRTGYTFVGWYDNADYASGTQYYSETGASARTWNKTANTTLYAGWTKNGYDCKAGEYLNVTACKVCEAGYYCPNGAMSYTYTGEIQGRSSCPSGYTDGGTGATTQAQCVMSVPGGKYVANKNASSATDCLCGTYKAAHTVNYGQVSSCITTDAGYYAAAGASKQTQASLGYYAAAGACEQTKVNAGCYADETGSSTACPKSCASLGGGLYTKSDAGSDAAEDCYITTTGGYYIANLMDAEETKCEADYYCPAITLTYPNVGGRELCPDPKVAGNVETVADFAWLSTACPDANVGNTTIKSVAMLSYGNTGLSAITQCRVQYTVDTPCAQFVIEGVRYNNEKYATTSGNRHSKKLNAGYYYTQRYSSTYCDGTGNEKRAMLYKAAAKCPANSYCPGGTVPKCNAGTYAETWGATSCTALGSFYTTSVEGATATSACYGETTAGNYISTAGDGEETCIAGSYCPGGIMVNYNSIGGSINCPGGYTAGGTGLKAQSECKISVAGGKYVGTANSSTLSTCVAGTSKAAHAVNYGQTSSCEMCSNWSYSGEGAASCTSCPSVTSGWSKTDSTGTGWKSYTSCKQTQKPANCASGVVTKTATSSTQWGTSTVTTALTANANYYVADTTCSACSGLANGFYPNSVAGNSGGSSVCYTDSLSGKYVATPKANGATDCAAGTAKAEHTVNYGETSTCDVCGENQYSDAGASSCTPCATPYGYGNTGTTAEEHAGRASCKTVCDAGMYVATAGAACENVGAGYYAPGGEVSYGSISKNRGQCPVQLTTIGYGYGANEADDCGRKLHAGDGVVYLRSAKKNPDELALNVRLNITNDNGGSEERVFFGNMTTEEKFMSDGVAKALKINVDDTVYYVHDDSVM